MHFIITGASSGIGEAIARQFATRAGAKLTLVARRRDKLVELAESLPCESHVEVQDLAVQTSSPAWIAEATQRFGAVDVLVNNAGAQVIGDTASVDPDIGERSISLNLFSPLRLTQAVLPAMLERGDGHIINICSMAALAPTPRMTYYNASKAGLAAASEAMRGEYRGTGVNILTVYPGIIAETDLAQTALGTYAASRLLSLQPTGTTSILARRIDHGLRARKARVIYPRTNALARHFPSTTRWLMDRYTPQLATAKAGESS